MATATPLPPLPPPTTPTIGNGSINGAGGGLNSYGGAISGQLAPSAAQYQQAMDQIIRSGNFPNALAVNGVDVVTTALGVTFTGGVQETPFSLGTPTNGSTITPNPSDELVQSVTNNVAGFTIAATSQVGFVVIVITNGASAGTISFSGFTKQWAGDVLDTTSGHVFVVFIYGLPGGKSAYLIKAMQ